MSIRKEAKARWVYECNACDKRQEAVDHFRAIEYGQRHEKTSGHVGAVLSGAMTDIFNTITEALSPVMDAMTGLAELFAPPANIPHDPALLRDRRKWGGK